MKILSLSICQIIVIFHCLSTKLVVDHQSLETQHGLLNGLGLILAFPCKVVNLTIEENLCLLDLLLSDKSWPTHCLLVVAHAIPSCSSPKLGLLLCFLVHVILNFAVRLAVKDHL